jgi:amino acid transporter
MNPSQKAKKFGAFAGVFTPSLLTILGVIMYMRLGWVVGHAGLYSTLVIILLAHVISFTTGLSVSSIATDKKIKAGGIYYVLSRSLGLPIGGAIGIALVIGTALSISLYLIGFAESFLSIDYIREFSGLEPSINSYRIIGTLAILLLVIIAYISTSFALRTQFYILGAIALSLVSIAIGISTQTDYQAASVLTSQAEDGLPFELLFAVFFPAVTGFTAGIAMSGDLKDPGKAIPRGTLGAIIVGFLVYVGLAIGFSIYVDRELLLNDTNFLLKVSWLAPLVIAGIWGATLSSALGGILGGPRITQAMATDKIGPRMLSKGYGLNNEPRTALLFVFLIAEAGILIGDLNVIARVVTMFYLASYGFINLAFYLESVASVDFRPTFKVNKHIGLAGFLVAFGMMFKLDFLAMFVALILMAALYFILKRRQLKIDYVDVWRSVWLSITRVALSKMESSKEADHTWLPNIILFSGGTEQRPHLIKLGKMMVGKQGILSNFDLIEQAGAEELFPKIQHEHPQPFAESGMFARRLAVNNAYAGIEMIAQTYGFSGVEPNTVMLGWANQTKNPAGFAKLLSTFKKLDMNAVVVRYDHKAGFGAYKTIDCWITDQSSNSNFIINLSKLLLISDKWIDAKPRVLFVNNKNENQAEILRTIELLLDTIRLNAKVKVINNQLEQKPYSTIVQETSNDTDLVIMELPEVSDQSASEFIEENNQLLEKIGTVVMLSASTKFSKIEVVKKTGKTGYPSPKEDMAKLPQNHLAPALPENILLATQIDLAWKMMQEELGKLWKTSFSPLLHYRTEKAKNIRQLMLKTQQTLEAKLPQLKAAQKTLFIHQLKSSVLARLGSLAEEQRSLLEKEQIDYLQPIIKQLFELAEKLSDNMDNRLTIAMDADDLRKDIPSGIGLRFFVFKKKLQLKMASGKKPITYHIKLKKLAKSIIYSHIDDSIRVVLSEFNQAQLRLAFEYRKLIYASNDAFTYLENHAREELSEEQMQGFRQTIELPLEEIIRQTETQTQSMQGTLYNEFSSILSTLGSSASGLHPNRLIKTTTVKSIKKRQLQLLTIPEKWQWQQEILLQTLQAEAHLMITQARLTNLMKGSFEEINSDLVQPILTQLTQIECYFNDIPQPETKSSDNAPSSILNLLNYQEERMLDKTNRIFEKTLRNAKSIQKSTPEKIRVFSEQSLNSLINNQLDYAETQELSVSRLLDASVQSLLIEPFYKQANELLQKVFDSASKVNDAIRLAALNLQSKKDDDENQTFDAAENMEALLAEQQKIVMQQRQVMEKNTASFNQKMKEQMKESQLVFSVYGLLKSVQKSNQNKPQSIHPDYIRKLNRLKKKTTDFIEQTQAKFWHSQSDARLMTERLAKSQSSHQHSLSEIIQLKEQLTPARDIFNKLPFYYQQLFAGKLNEQNSLWVGREMELDMARKAIQRYKSGHKGLVVVTGDYGSGKTFFVNHLIARFLINRKVFSLKTVAGGSIDKELLLQAIRQATGLNGSLHEIMSAMPKQAVLFVDCLELWWERTPQGIQFIQELVSLLGEVANKMPVIVSCQKLTYKLIAQQTDIGSKTIQHIELFPMNSRDLQKAILLRHRTSGYGLQIDRASPVSLSINREAKLFSRLFKQSEGNIGSALLMWMAAIANTAEKTIVVNTPKSADLSPLQGIDSDLKQILLHFLLHRQMGASKLQRVSHFENQALHDKLQLLVRMGLLKNPSGNLYEIDPYMLHHINTLIQTELLNPTENNLIK